MMDENDRSHEDYRSLRHISRKEGSEDTAPIEVDSSAFFSELPPEQPSTPPPAQPPQKPPRSGHNTPVPPKAQPPMDGAVAVPSKWGKILLILQGILSILALVQLWRTQMLPVLYLVILAALLALLWLLMKPLNAIVTRLPLVSTVNGLGGAALGLVCGGLTLFVAVWAMQRFGWLLTPELIDGTTLLKFFATQTPLGLLAAL